jgi:hypothetical protein
VTPCACGGRSEARWRAHDGPVAIRPHAAGSSGGVHIGGSSERAGTSGASRSRSRPARGEDRVRVENHVARVPRLSLPYRSRRRRASGGGGAGEAALVIRPLRECTTSSPASSQAALRRVASGASTGSATHQAPSPVAVRALDPADSGPALVAVAVPTAEARDARDGSRARSPGRRLAAARRRCRTPIEHCAAPFERLTTDR